MKTQTYQMERLICTIKEKDETAQESSAQFMAELKAEVSALKRLVVASSVDDSHGNSSAERAIEEDKNQKPSAYERMEQALRELHRQNSATAIQEGAGILCMYVKNLIDNSDKPRYRRISTANENFKSKIALLDGHYEFLQSIGFTKKGTSMLEWTWYSSDDTSLDQDGLTVLEVALKALEILRTGSGSIDDVCDDARRFYQDQCQASTSVVAVASVEEVEEPTPAANDFQHFLSKLKPAGSINEPITDTEDPPSEPKSEGEEKIQDTKDPPIEPSPEPTYPKSFTEVAKMLQNGETIPGIKEVEEKLSIDAENPTPATMSPRNKPWGDSEAPSSSSTTMS